MEFQQRAREKAAKKAAERKNAPGAPYSSLRRSEGPKRGGGPGKARGGGEQRRAAPATVGPLTPWEWKKEVWRLCHGRSILSGVPVRLGDGLWVWQAHHPLPKSLLPPELRFHPDNGVVLLTLEHLRHEGRVRDHDRVLHTIPLEKLPERAVRFAAELGPEYLELLHRHHPPADRLEGRTPNQEVVDGRRANRRSRP
jgi:hypothetical protein